MNLQEIQTFSVELTGYRKGETRAEFRLQQGLLVWKQSTRWMHNFMRSLSQDEIECLFEALEEANIEAWKPFYPDLESIDSTQPYHALWHLRLQFVDGSSLERWGKDDQPLEYSLLMDRLSALTRECLMVMD